MTKETRGADVSFEKTNVSFFWLGLTVLGVACGLKYLFKKEEKGK